ncbi:MAG: Ig-like domain-containing protein, partial [Methanocellales archaeon]|nr:Ig-like domain-containing protein [Methanocellales archaeon]
RKSGELFYVNFTYTEERPANYTVRVYNSTATINTTTVNYPVGGSNKVANVSFYLNSSAADGSYNVSVGMYDNFSNYVISYQNNSVVKDTTSPAITIDTPTTASKVYRKSGELFYVNFTYTELNPANYTVNVYNSTETINTTTLNYPAGGADQIANVSFYLNSSAADWSYNVSVNMYDNVSNYVISYQNNSVVKDTTGPTVTIVNPKNETYNTLSLTLDTDIGTDAQSCWYSLNGGTNTSFTWGDTVNIIANEGNNNVTVYANDTLGNIGSDRVLFSVNTSIILCISITSPANGTITNRAQPQLTLLAIDKNYPTINYTLYIYYENGTLYSVGNSGTLDNNTQTTIVLSPAINLIGNSTTYKVIAAANDSALNSANSSDLYITLQPPVLYLISPEYGYWDKDGNITFIFKYDSISFETANCSLYINGIYNQSNETTANKIEATFNVAGIAEGQNQNWTINCTMNGIHVEDTRIFHVDKTLPTIDLSYPSNAYNTNSTTINFNWTATDNFDTSLLCNLTIDGVVNASNIVSPNATLTNHTVSGFAEGTHYWNVTCTDNAGNVNTSETRSFIIDRTPPTVLIDTPTNIAKVYRKSGELFYVNFTYTELNPANYTVNVYNSTETINTTTVNYPVGGADKVANVSFYLNSSAADGFYNVSVGMYDNLSNYNISYQNNSVVKDATNPTITIDTPTTASKVYRESGELFYVNFTYTELNPANYTVNVYNSTETINTTTVNYPVGGADQIANVSFYLNSSAADGSYNVSVNMYDNVSNYVISYQNNSVVKDTTAPSVTAITVNQWYLNNSVMSLNASITDDLSGVSNATVNVSAINSTLNEVILVKQDGDYWTNATIIADRGNTAGLQNLTITAYDNISLVNNTVNMTVGIDENAPSVTAITINQWYANNSVMTLNASITDSQSGVKNATVNVSAINSTLNEVVLVKQGGNYWTNATIIADRGNTAELQNLTITAYDNVSNVNNTVNMTAGID